MKNVIERTFNIDIVGHIVLDEEESLITESGDVIHSAGNEIVHGDDFMPFFQKIFTDMRSEKTGAAGYQSPWHDYSPRAVEENRSRKACVAVCSSLPSLLKMIMPSTPGTESRSFFPFSGPRMNTAVAYASSVMA